MILRECFRTATSHLFSHWSRSLLAMLGIMIGTMSTVTLVYSVELFKHETISQYTQMGVGVMLVRVHPDEQPKDCSFIQTHKKLLASVPHVARVEPIIDSQIKHAVQQSYSTVIGIQPSFMNLLNHKIVHGRSMTDSDQNQGMAWVGHTLNQQYQKQSFFSDQFWFYEMPLTPAGYLSRAPSPSFLALNINESVLVPLDYLCQHAEHIYGVSYILEVDHTDSVAQISRDVKKIFNKDEQIKNVMITSPAQIIQSMNESMRYIRYLATLIGGVSLLVGGIGIMNIMLANILERRREIAIRLCFGACQADIIKMFLVESSLLCTFSGLIGTVSGVGLIGFIAHQVGWQWQWLVLPLLLGMTLALITGLVFGLYPAYQACRQTPAKILKEG